jgi:leucyl aminopeptidase
MKISIENCIRGVSDLLLPADDPSASVPVWATSADGAGIEAHDFPEYGRVWLNNSGWKARAGNFSLIQNDGALAGVVFGLGRDPVSPFKPLLPGALPPVLPQGTYHFANSPGDDELAAIAWALGAYQFSAFRSGADAHQPPRRLKLAAAINRDRAVAIASAVWFARELINYPANEMGPAELEMATRDLARHHGAEVHVIEGLRLLADNFPLIHAVGRASDRDPRLIDMVWGEAAAPKVLNIKPSNAMGLMKKDMGGAASALALGAMIMAARLPVRLRLLIPAADNNISANAFRPGDILRARNGMTVEIANTDAEGRLVLADALSLADEEKPDYLIDFATLTGSARVALGPDLPPFYTNDEVLAQAIANAGYATADPAWRMPFWGPYDQLLKSRIADVNHIYNSPFAGSVTAALFLKRFVKATTRYVHFDIYGWVPRAQPARPQGGEPQMARAMFHHLAEVYPPQ